MRPNVMPTPRPDKNKTISDILFDLPDPDLRSQLEEFRIEWEELNGPVDLTRRYISQWPREDQLLVYKLHPDRYFAALPPFVQDFLRSKMEIARADGVLDDMPSTYLELFLSGTMARTHTPQRRG